MDSKKELLIALVISVILNFNATSIVYLLIRSLFFAFLLFIILNFAGGSVQYLREKKIKLGLIFIVQTIIAAAIFVFGYLFVVFGTGCFPSITPDHFRTNIVTGGCDYGGGAGCSTKDPWYYRPNCENDAKKLEAIKNTRYEEMRTKECKQFCDEANEGRFCNTVPRLDQRNGPANIDCNLFVNCDKIDCS